jgi:hypothetical protein
MCVPLLAESFVRAGVFQEGRRWVVAEDASTIYNYTAPQAGSTDYIPADISFLSVVPAHLLRFLVHAFCSNVGARG